MQLPLTNPVNRLRFGIFMPPMNSPATQNPTTSLVRDIKTIQLMDDLGFDEAWVGEHHSAGTEIIADPLTFIAHVGALTRHIKLGTGVVSLPYHNPLWIADRAILVDHLLRGRLMLGLGPGSLPTDAAMIGLEPEQLRGALSEDLDVLMRLLRGERVSHTTDRYTLVDAATQLAPYSDPCFDVAVAANSSLAGPTLAGRHGLSILSVGATTELGFDLLGHHWNHFEKVALEHGHTPDRSRWRMFGPMHIAETVEQAMDDVSYGFMEWCDYTQKTLALPTVRADGESFEERVDWVNRTGLGVIGTPDMAIAQIKRLMEQSNGGFGCYMLMQHDWANWAATERHFELFARHVIPAFQPSQRRLLASEEWARSRHAELDAKNMAAISAWNEGDPNERRSAE